MGRRNTVPDIRDEFLSEEDLDLRNLTWDELIAYWNLWLEQAQTTNDLDEALYSHGVFDRDPAVLERQAALQGPGRKDSEAGLAAGSRVDRSVRIADRFKGDDDAARVADQVTRRIDELGVDGVVGGQDREDRVVAVHAVHAEVVPTDQGPAAGGEGTCFGQSSFVILPTSWV